MPLTEQGEAHAPALQQEDGSHAQRYPLKRLYVMDGDTTVEKLEAGKQIKESKSDDCLFGVHIGHHKGNKKRDSLQSKLDSVPISTTQEAEKVWRLLRQHAETTHGSMQRAFRTVDRDGSGRIEITELRHLVAVHLSIDLEEDLLQFIFHCLDRGDKGAITYQEFVEALQGPLVSRPGASALEMQEHPLSKTFGQALASQRAPSKHSKSWDSFVTTASKSGDRILQNGAASYQLGDRHAWKSMNMYETTSLVQQRAVKESFGCDPIPPDRTTQTKTPCISACVCVWCVRARHTGAMGRVRVACACMQSTYIDTKCAGYRRVRGRRLEWIKRRANCHRPERLPARSSMRARQALC